MNCPSCGQLNRDGATFCTRCGSPLNAPAVCPKCGTPAEADDQFCAACGEPLTATPTATSAAAPVSTQPTTFCDGRYQVVRFLGEGGKKRVFLAHDTRLDRDVAFALIKTEGLNAEGETRIRREAQAMGKLGDHPHIVPVYDIGEEAGQPYLVTQLMGGGDVEGVIEKAPDHRVPLETALRIADQVCQALEYAHAKGIVHRDLKPGNVWLTADGTAKLGDFGLAVALDRSRLTQAGMMVGTVHYMPPEQAIGGEVTPRSDLYALGAMLYEMTCGRPPFVGDESVAIITQHLNTPPVAPSWHVPDLPSGLEALLLRLLEKDPAKRPAAASEVRSALAGVASLATRRRGPDRDETEDAVEKPLSDPLYGRTFVGREQELHQLQSAFDAAVSGQGSLAMVVGEPGIGKTSLCEQLATYVAVRGGRALVGHCYEEGSLSLPYLPFVEAMRSYVLTREPDDLRRDLGSGATEVARLVSEVRDRLQVELRPPGDPEDDRWRLLQAVSGFLHSASMIQPLLLVLEDLHDADRGTIDLLLHLARNLQGARILIVGTYRDVEVDRGHPLSSALAELRRAGSLLRVPLRGLTVDEVQRMMSMVRGQEVPWSRAEAIHRQTEGNPLFVQEVLRYLVEEGIVVREAGRYLLTDAEAGIPEGLRDVVGKRLSRLSEKTNQVLSVAAVIGREFRLDVLQKVAGLPEEELYGTLEEATERAVVEQRQAVGWVVFRFTHAFFRQTLYEEIFVPRRIRLHQQVGNALEEVYGRRLEEHAAELAEHFVQSTESSDLDKALRYCELAAERSMQVFAYGEAIRHLERALSTQEVLDPDDKAKRCRLLLLLAEALGPAGEPQRAADQVAEEAFALAEAVHDSALASEACAVAFDSLTRHGGVSGSAGGAGPRWAERADRHAMPGTAARVYADLALGLVAWGERRFADRSISYRRALDGARRLGEPRLLFDCGVYMLSGMDLGSWQEILALASELAGLPREGTGSLTLAEVLNSCASSLLAAGDRDSAEALWRELGEMNSRTGDRFLAVRSATLAITVATLDGELERAVDAAANFSALAEEAGSPLYGLQAGMRAMRANIYLGRVQVALDGLIRFQEARGRDNPERRALCLAYLGQTADGEDLLDDYMTRWSSSPPGPETGLAEVLYLLELAVLLEKHDAAGLLSSLLRPLAHLLSTRDLDLNCVARHLGAAAALLDNRDDARTLYEQALAVCGKVRFRPEIALTRLQLAELMLDHYPNEQVTARTHLDFAIEEFRAMKMQPALERALGHKGLLKA